MTNFENASYSSFFPYRRELHLRLMRVRKKDVALYRLAWFADFPGFGWRGSTTGQRGVLLRRFLVRWHPEA